MGLAIVLLLLFALGGCTADPLTGDGPSVRQIALHHRPADPSGVVVLVVDDGDHAEAIALRERLARALQDILSTIRFNALAENVHWQPEDPAAPQPAAIRVVLVRPSAQGSARIARTLALAAGHTFDDDARALGRDVGLALRQLSPSPRTAPYQPLDALQSTWRLLRGTRGAGDAYEAAVVAEVPARSASMLVLVASTRDDASPGSARDYASDDLAVTARIGVIAPFERVPNSERCEGELSRPSRIGTWAERAWATATAWPCDDDAAWRWPFGCSPHRERIYCYDRPVANEASGRAQCAVILSLPESAHCEETRGWLDPRGADGVRRPKIITDAEGRRLRECEIRQLEGTALASCRTSAECAGCGSGWCRTDVPELQELDRASCEDPRRSVRMRFVGSAYPWGGVRLRQVCNLTSCSQSSP
jgi:hypothetical protein